MRNKTVAIIGSESIIGRGLGDLQKFFNVIPHNGATLEWNQPLKTEVRIKRGSPDVFVIAYSAWDLAEERLCNILRIVQKAASERKVKIIGFISSQIYEGCTKDTPIDESIVPQPLTTMARAEVLFEERLLKYPNSIVFRLGEYYDTFSGFPTKLARRMLGDPNLKVDETSKFSVTHRVTLVKALQLSIENDMVHRFQLVDQDEVTERDLYELLEIPIKALGHRIPVKYVSGKSYRVLDSARWEAVSMKEGVHWSVPMKDEIPFIVRAVYGTK